MNIFKQKNNKDHLTDILLQQRANIAIAAGGTGGHLFPAIAIAELLLKFGYKVTFITDEGFYKYPSETKNIIMNEHFSIIKVGRIKRLTIYQKISAIFKVTKECIKLCIAFRKKKVSIVVGFGSYVSLPSVIAGFLSKIPVAIHEQNCHIGLANKISLLFVTCCMTSFPETTGVPKKMLNKIIFTGNPVRKAIRNACLKNKLTNVNYDSIYRVYNRVNILILGGSQGATALSVTIPEALCSLPVNIKQKLSINHQVPKTEIENIRKIYQENAIFANIAFFFENIAELMSEAHILISRSGASTIAEIVAIGIPSILIPYPSSTNNHQLKNAIFLQNHGASILIEQSSLTSNTLRRTIEHVLLAKDEGSTLAKMSNNAKSIFEQNAEIKVCSIIEMILFGEVISALEDGITEISPSFDANIGTS